MLLSVLASLGEKSDPLFLFAGAEVLVRMGVDSRYENETCT